MRSTGPCRRFPSWAPLAALACLLGGCDPAWFRQEADRIAASIIGRKQAEALGHSEAFTIEQPSQTLRRRLLLAQRLPYSGQASLGAGQLGPLAHWPEKGYPGVPARRAPQQAPAELPGGDPVKLTLLDALQVAARNHREYQTRKEDIFRAALALDLESQAFRNTFYGAMATAYSTDLSGSHPLGGLDNSAEARWSRQLKTGATLTSRIAVDLVKLMTLDRSFAMGILADASITVPLLRGAGQHIVTEPLTQAQRETVYAIYTFERFKRTLAVRTASEYLGTLQQLDQVKNTEDNYRRLTANGRRARRLAEAGRLPEIQVDQARQDELRARDRWVTAQQTYVRRLDALKATLGLPTDARVDLDRDELQRLAEAERKVLGDRVTTRPATAPSATAPAVPASAPIELVEPSREGGGPLEMEPAKAIQLAMENRLDLRVLNGRAQDAQRQVVVAADALKANLTLVGTAEAGGRRSLGTGLSNAHLRPEKGLYGIGLLLDLPWERTAERNAYRNSYIALERAVRDVQDLEDQVKFDVRNALRNLLQARESFKIQAEAVALARRRVASTELFLEAGRAQIRDVLEAQEALVSAQNALTAALVSYRVAELELQRDMDVLEVDTKGLWREYEPK